MSNLSALAESEIKEGQYELQQWISPPDFSVNYDTVYDAHQEGTVAWCTQGNTFARWTESGSLLWIHAKCTYTFQPPCHYRC